jgi:septal ring factor EnvC (AmiA/AmiB activator)
MPDVTLELMFEVLKPVQARLTQVDGKIDELKQEMQASRTAQNGIRQEITSVFVEISGIHKTLIRHEDRLDRIERRLELSDAPTI